MGFAHFFHLDEEDLLGLVPVGSGEASPAGSESDEGGAALGAGASESGELRANSGLLAELAGLGEQVGGLQGEIGELKNEVGTLGTELASQPQEAPEAPAAPGPVGDPNYPGGVAPHVSENQPGTGGWVRVGPASAAVSHTMTTKPIKKAVH